jgi:lipopolysaccharide biosynthesis regulator YciM
MPNRIDIDHRHSRAILREIGERLRGSLREEPELTENLRKQVDRLNEFEDQSPSIVPRWTERLKMNNEQQRELQEQLMLCRVMEREATDPLASRLLQDIVAEMEAALQQPEEYSQIMQKPGVILDHRAPPIR